MAGDGEARASIAGEEIRGEMVGLSVAVDGSTAGDEDWLAVVTMP